MDTENEVAKQQGRPKRYAQKIYLNIATEKDLYLKLKYLAERDCGGNLTKYCKRIFERLVNEQFKEDDEEAFEEYVRQLNEEKI